MMFIRRDENFRPFICILYGFDHLYGFLHGACRSASCGENDICRWIGAKCFEETLLGIAHHFGWIFLINKNFTSIVTKLCVWICWNSLCVFDHILDRSIGTARRSIIDINTFELNVEWTDILCVKTDNVLSGYVDFLSFFLVQHFLLGYLFYVQIDVRSAIAVGTWCFFFVFWGERILHLHF